MNPLLNARAELERLVEQDIEMHRKIDVLQKAIRLLEPCFESDADLEAPPALSLAEMLAQDNFGITQAVEKALMSRPGQALSPTQIRDLLTESGFEVRGKSPMAQIHTVLKRLVAKQGGPVIEVKAPGKILYRFRSFPKPNPAPQEIILDPIKVKAK